VNPNFIVVDANIAFKALAAGRGDLRDRLGPTTGLQLFAPKFLFVELFKLKEQIAKAGRISEDDLLEALHALVNRLDFVNEATIPAGTWMEAYRLCKDVDEKDTPYVALALHLDGRLWTDDGELVRGLEARGFHAFYGPG